MRPQNPCGRDNLKQLAHTMNMNSATSLLTTDRWPSLRPLLRALTLLSAILLAACDAFDGRNSANDPPQLQAASDGRAPATRADGWWQPRADENLSWYWQLQGEIDLNHNVDVYALDYQTPAETVRALKARGKRVICYVSVGSTENYRPDASAFPASVVGDPYHGYPEEHWLDTTNISALAPIMRARFDICAASGFDAIEGDNVDAYTLQLRDAAGALVSVGTRFGITAEDSITYVKWLAAEAHARGLGFGLKNAEQIAARVLDDIDWMMTESCEAYTWCEQAAVVSAANKPVFMTEYVGVLDDFSAACATARQYRFSAIYRDRALGPGGTFQRCD